MASEKPIIALLGNGGVGKTTYIEKLCKGKFNPRYYMSTQYQDCEVCVNGQHVILRDYPGQDQYVEMRKNSYHDVDAAIIMASDSKLTQRDLPKWIAEFTNAAKTRWNNGDYGSPPFVVVLNKSDLKINYTELPEIGIVPYRMSVRKEKNLEQPIIALLDLLM